MRILHTADWHLGRLFHGLHLTDDQAYVLEELHAVVKETKPDVLVIAGDIYDRAVPPTEAVTLLDETLSRLLLDAKLQVVLIAGNHDSPERIGFGSRLLAGQGLHVFGAPRESDRPFALSDAYGEVWFAPLPFAEPSLVRSVYGCEADSCEAAMAFLTGRALAAMPPAARKVAVAHAFVAGGAPSESERALSVAGNANVPPALFAPFHYAALGHLHNAQRAGAETVRYSGSLLKYSFDEAGQKKGCCLVELDATGAARVEGIALRPRRDVRKIEGYFDDILQDRDRYPASDDYVCVSLLDAQAILDVHGQLRAIYPNLMQVERPGLYACGVLEKERRDCRGKSERLLFDDFFRQMTGEALSEAQAAAFDRHLDALRSAQREAQP